MIDLHTHFLPGVDDGARNMEEAIEMLRLAAADGTRRMVATPHQRHPAGYDVGPAEGAAALAEVAAAAAAAGIEIELSLGAEVHLYESILADLDAGTISSLSANRRYFLLELPVTYVPGNLGEMIFEFQMAGCFPVLAHPERNMELVSRPETVRELRGRGVLMQVTAKSVVGEFGRKAEKMVKKLLKWGVVDVIASDAHDPVRRPPGLSPAVAAAARVVGSARAEAMVTTAPERILAGEGMD